MPGISTENLAEQINTTNQRVDVANQRLDLESRRLADSIQHLDRKVTDINRTVKLITWLGAGALGCATLVLVIAFDEVRRTARVEMAIGAVKENTAELKDDFKRAQAANRLRDDQFAKMMDAIVRLEK